MQKTFLSTSNHINHVLFAGGSSPRSLPVLPAAVQPERAGVCGHVHPDRHARDAGMRRPGRHKCLYHHPLDGHADSAHRQEVSNNGVEIHEEII